MSLATPKPSSAAPVGAPVGIGWRHPHYAELLQTQSVLDFIEVHSENFFADGGAALSVLEQGRACYPVSLHGVGLSLGSAMGIDAGHLEQLARLVERTDPVRVSDHACFARVPLQGQTVHAADLLPLPMTEAALAVMCANVQRVQDRLRRPIAVENLSTYVQWCDAEMDEPTFLNTLAQRTGCGLLVDVNNLYVNALNAQLRGEHQDPLATCQAWLDAIDSNSVAELHLAGHVHTGDIVIDDHGSRVVDAVWSLYGHAMHRLGSVPTLIEWDTDVPDLSVLLDEAERARRVSATALADTRASQGVPA
ncbi:DUF692 domain-containing protein [Hydrogenophaga sp.]|uniref:MNIO family bufferin maturase n=1 Tax=Hydrogenophaga sp. TaxID=1904254 RepID=UPI0025C5BF75|nr:DUF692 domain-containing protein [Hydrogenophaga sp.]